MGSNRYIDSDDTIQSFNLEVNTTHALNIYSRYQFSTINVEGSTVHVSGNHAQ